MFDYKNSSALVTGASRGIGAEIARELARRGIARLILTARTREDLEKLAAEIGENLPIEVTVIEADLSDSMGAQKVYEATQAQGLSVDLLVNNAGFGYFGLFETAEPGRDDRMVAVNIESLVALTRLFLPAMKRNGRGGIINVASTAAFQPVPYMSLYGATKAFVLSFSEALWAENKESGVNVVCLCPGGTDTAFDFGDQKRGSFENTPRSTPQEVAVQGLDALDRNLPHIVVGLANNLFTYVPRFVPRGIMARTVEVMFRPKEKSGEGKEKKASDLPVGALAIGLVAGGALLVSAWRNRHRG